MAYRSIRFAEGENPEELYRAIGPNQVHGAVNQLISFLSMPFGKPEANVPAEVERIIADEVSWFQQIVDDASDPKPTALHLGEKLGEGLNLDNPDISAGSRACRRVTRSISAG